MASKTELNNIIKQKEQAIKSLTTLNNQLKNRLKDEIDKSGKILNALHEVNEEFKKINNIKWWQIWK